MTVLFAWGLWLVMNWSSIREHFGYDDASYWRRLRNKNTKDMGKDDDQCGWSCDVTEGTFYWRRETSCHTHRKFQKHLMIRCLFWSDGNGRWMLNWELNWRLEILRRNLHQFSCNARASPVKAQQLASFEQIHGILPTTKLNYHWRKGVKTDATGLAKIPKYMYSHCHWKYWHEAYFKN